VTIHTGFNDAWETPGWTSQNMAYPGHAVAPLTALPTVRVFGTFVDDQNRPLEVQVTAVPDVHAATSGGATVMVDTLHEISVRGIIDFTIPVGNWNWTFRLRVGPSTFVKNFMPVEDLDLQTLVETGQDGDVILDGGTV
jgi:hypothetical protein